MEILLLNISKSTYIPTNIYYNLGIILFLDFYSIDLNYKVKS